MAYQARKIAKWNEREYHDRLQVGEIIWLKKKQKRAPKQYKNHPHHVNKGESLYSIAQFYGIRLKSIIRKNPQLMVRQYQVGWVMRSGYIDITVL